MKRKSTNYNTPDAGGWQAKCDDLFLARFRGRPCVICGTTKSFNPENGRTVRSNGHHLHHKGSCRKFRYDEKNIVGSLCCSHHSKWAKDISPHADVHPLACTRFDEWMQKNRPEQWAWFKSTEMEARKPFNREWCYREKYVELGGEIESTTGLMRDYKPKNHTKKVREAENDYR